MKLKPTLRRLLNPALTTALVAPGIALAAPAGEEVVRGSAAIERPDANGTVINQLSDRAVVNWQSFSVGGQEYVLFNQPSASSVILNRVLGNDASTILGTIQSNGRVFLVNPNGIFFGESASLNVGGMVASTLDIDDDDFMDGRYVLRRDAGAADGTVQNDGTITTAEGGFVVLAGDYVENTGVVAAQLGHVVMASGAEVTLDMDGSGLIGFAVDQATLAELAGVRNTGEILAAGGMVIMTAEVARDLMSTVVNNEGLIAAHSVEDRSGVIYLHGDGGDVEHSGALIADGLGAGESGGDIRLIASGTLTLDADATISAQGSERGGFVEVSGHQNLNLGGDITIGNGGELLIDPNTLTIVASGGGPGGTFTDSEIGVGFIAFQLDSNTDVRLIATQLITADPAVTALVATGGNGNLFINIGIPSGASAGNCGDLGFCAGGDTGFSVATGGSGGDILLGNMDINILGEFSALGDPDPMLSGQIALGHVSAAQILINGNGSLTTGNLTATNGNVDINFGSMVQTVDVDLGNIVAANGTVYIEVGSSDQALVVNIGHMTSTTGDVNFYMWSDNPAPGTDSANIGMAFALDEIYLDADLSEARNLVFMVAGVDAPYVSVNPELYGGGMLTFSVGNITAEDAVIDGRVYGPTGGGTLTISGMINVTDELYIWTYGDQPVNLSIANHISGANTIDIESNGDLDALNVSATYEVDVSATGDVTVGDLFAGEGIWLGSDAGSVTAANVSVVNTDTAGEASIYINAWTGMNIGGVSATAEDYASMEISNDGPGDIVVMGGINAQAPFGEGSLYINQSGDGDISVGGLINANYLQIFHWVPGFTTTLAGVNMTPAGDGTSPYLNLSLDGSVTLGDFSYTNVDPADDYVELWLEVAHTVTILGTVNINATGDVALGTWSPNVVLGPAADISLTSTGGGSTFVQLLAESFQIDGDVQANEIRLTLSDWDGDTTNGATYTIAGSGSLHAVNPGGTATLKLDTDDYDWSDIQAPQVSLQLGSINVQGETVEFGFDLNTGAVTDFTLSGGLTMAQSSTTETLALELELTAGMINISSDQSLDLSGSTLESPGLVQLTSNAGNLHVSGASIEAGTLVIQAAGNILNATPASLSANAMLLETPGNIDLGASTLTIGDGTISGAVGDPDAMDVLVEEGIVASSVIPNGTFGAGGTVSIGTLTLDGSDYLLFQGSSLSLGTLNAPSTANSYLVQVASNSQSNDLLLTGTAAGTASASWDDFLSKFTGATFILGASDFLGVIDTGRTTELDMGSANVLFASTIDPPLLGEVITSGVILTMDGRVGVVEERPFRPPTTAEILGTEVRVATGTRTVTRFGTATTSGDDPERDDTITHGSDDDLVCE